MSVFAPNLVNMSPISEESHVSRLCYVFINKYKGLEDIEIIIDPNFACHYDKANKALSIEKSATIPDNFWGRGICSVAAIVGDNGVGKSTAVEFILKAIVDGAKGEDINGILVYEKNGGILLYSKDRVTLPKGVLSIASPEKICCLYYNGHFVPGLSFDNLRLGELAGNYNISDGFLLMKDVQNYSNTDFFYKGLTFEERFLQYNAQNHIRICKMLANRELCDRIKGFFLPKYILVVPNSSGCYAKAEYDKLKSVSATEVKKVIPEKVIKNKERRESVLTDHIYCNFLNILFNETHFDVDDSVLDCLKDWQTYLFDDKPVLEQFDDFITNRVGDSNLSRRLRLVYSALSELTSLASFYYTPFIQGFFYLKVEEDYEKICHLCNLLEKSDYIVAQYFDVQYSQDLYGGTVLSSGEQSLLDLFSRLYTTIQRDRIRFSNLNAPALLILDEAEHSFHPAWQRQYVELLLNFLQQLLVRPGLKFQILISTHSPVLLSDIPLNGITFMKKEDGVVKNAHPEMNGSFASNIFDLYRNSFFLDKGMIGEFAMNKLRALEDRANNTGRMGKEEFKSLMKEINLIGDFRIRAYLLNCINKDKERDEITFLKEKLQELEKKASYEQN